MTWEPIAREAYIAYAKATDNKSWSGQELRPWENLPEKIRKAWVDAAKRVVQYNIELKNDLA